MKDYEDMNLFDLASILQKMKSDPNFSFTVKCKDGEYPVESVDVFDGIITLSLCEECQAVEESDANED